LFSPFVARKVVRMTLRRLAGALTAGLALLGLAACTGSSDDKADAPPLIAPGGPGEPAKTLAPGQRPSLPATQPNAADVTFVGHMVVHHQQALDMAALVPDRASSASVKGLAARIADSQRVEIDAMTSWLKQHGAEHAMHGDLGPMPGMATPAQLDELKAASGSAFDALFLRLMIAHHEGALTMSREVQAKGSDQRVQELADEVITVQSGEIDRMKGIGP
jgi:uncharacterized protein (DUF305 family)